MSIAITGIGTVTGYGWDREALWNGLASGKHAANLVRGFGKNGQDGWVIRIPEGGDPKDGSRFARAMHAAGREAIADAESRGWKPGRRVGLIHATVLGDVEKLRAFNADPNWPVRDYLQIMPSTPTSLFMQEHDFHGPVINLSAMCASGNAAMLTAKMWLDTGAADDVVVVATDVSLETPEHLQHFVRLGVGIAKTEPTDACRPFQEGSRGFGMGEASVAFVLSNNTEGLSPYVQLLGGAMSHDAHHVTSINPDLVQVRRCFEDALVNAGVSANDVRYLNAHGPGTAQCDRAESTILKDLFLPSTGIYSVKPLTGHCQGAAALVEIVVTALGYDLGYLPLPEAVAAAHPQLLTGRTEVNNDGLTVKSSLGMGGHNSVIVLAPPA
jgi:3-oxoacyl-[acyl-carrier-protein] synthase II